MQAAWRSPGYAADPILGSQKLTRMVRISFLILLMLGQTVVRADDDPHSKPPEKLEAAYAAPAEMKSYFLHVHATEPQWLKERQVEDSFLIRSQAYYVARIVVEPTPINKDLKAEFEKLLQTSGDAKKEIETDPLLGPKDAYVIFNGDKKPVLIVYRQLGILTSSHAISVSGKDTFQAVDGWTSYNKNSAISAFLDSIAPEKSAYETPFTKWKGDSDDPF